MIRSFRSTKTGECKQKRIVKSEKNTIELVKAWQTTRKKTNTKNTEQSIGLLNRATDWEFRVDLDKRLVFPFEIEIRLRRDMILYSSKNKAIDHNRAYSSVGIENSWSIQTKKLNTANYVMI